MVHTASRAPLALRLASPRGVGDGDVVRRVARAASARDDQPQTSRASTACATLIAIALTASAPSWAFDGDAAGAFSSRGCVGCHAAGGNVVAASATLFARDLERNGVATKEDISNLIERGKGKMPGYGESCAPKGACTFGARFGRRGNRRVGDVRPRSRRGGLEVKLWK